MRNLWQIAQFVPAVATSCPFVKLRGKYPGEQKQNAGLVKWRHSAAVNKAKQLMNRHDVNLLFGTHKSNR